MSNEIIVALIGLGGSVVVAVVEAEAKAEEGEDT